MSSESLACLPLGGHALDQLNLDLSDDLDNILGQ